MVNRNKPITKSEARLSVGVAVVMFIVGFYMEFSGISGSWLIGDRYMRSGEEVQWIFSGLFIMALAAWFVNIPYKALRYMDLNHVDYVYRSNLKGFKNTWNQNQSQQYGQSQQYNQSQKQRVNAIPQGIRDGKQIFACPVCQKKIAVSVDSGKHILINCPCGRELDART